MTSYEMVQVVWHDAHAVNEWQSTSDISQEPCVISTVGFLIPSAKPNHVVVAQSIDPDGNLDGVLSIPEGMVVKVSVLSYDSLLTIPDRAIKTTPA
jgi:hypothetical protein